MIASRKERRSGTRLSRNLFHVSDFKKLLVWQKSHALALEAHRTAKRIRGADHLSLKSQLIRASMSIPANIVEGRGQESRREFARYLGIAVNSASELEYHLITGRDMGVISKADSLSLLNQVVEVRKMLHGLLKYARAPKPPHT